MEKDDAKEVTTVRDKIVMTDSSEDTSNDEQKVTANMESPVYMDEVTIDTIENNDDNEISFDPEDQPLSMPYAKE